MACQILGYKSSDLKSMTLEKLISNLEEQSIEAMEETDLLCAKSSKNESDMHVKGTVLVCGKVVSLSQRKSCSDIS